MSTATNIFLSRLAINNLEWTYIINIRVSSLDPKMAARVANGPAPPSVSKSLFTYTCC